MTDNRLDEMFAALADPARRGVVDLLRKKPRRAGELASALSISAARMSQHLRVLRKGGLIEDDDVEDDARVRLYRSPYGLHPASLRAASTTTWGCSRCM
jgi:DNA-binding transcriptional ArsR family regulator